MSLCRYPLAQQIGPRLSGRGEVQARGLANEAAVELLGERRMEVAGAQARLDVGHRHAAHEAGSGGGCGRRGVALDDDPVIGLGAQDLLDLLGHATELAGEPLLLDDVGAVVGDGDGEEVEQPGRKLDVLTRPEDIELSARVLQGFADRAELDDLRACAEGDENAHTVICFLGQRLAETKSSGMSCTVFDQTMGLVASSDSPRNVFQAR